jgi:ribosome-binding factor A
MDSRRQLKVASLFKEALANILTRTGKSIYGNAFVTVTNVRLTSDLLLVRYNFSVYNTDEPDAVIDALNKHKPELKKALGQELRSHVRRMPEVEFYRDGSLDYAFHIEDIFNKIKQEDAALKRELEEKKQQAEAPVKKAVMKVVKDEEDDEVPAKKAATKKAPAKKAAVRKDVASSEDAPIKKAPAKKAAAKKAATKKAKD